MYCMPSTSINLPDDWKKVPADKQFLYWIYFGIDACFCLKRHLISSEALYPNLDSSGSYFTEDKPFHKYLLTVTDQQEMSTCTGLSALDHANTKFSCGYATISVGLELLTSKKVNSESVLLYQYFFFIFTFRYANMGYAFASFLCHHNSDLTKVVSYDITCQWHKNVISPINTLPSLISSDLFTQEIQFAILKLHIHGHQLSYQQSFSLNWLRRAGRTDDEGVKQLWAHMGPVATSTCNMGPGSQHGTMNNHFSHWNWIKLVGLALDKFASQVASLNEFTEDQGEEETRIWAKEINEWNNEQLKPPSEQCAVWNPYELPKSTLAESDVRLLLTQEEACKAELGIFSLQDIGPTAFVSQVPELEDQQ
ncbi:hypothetical protein GYMLUDRAFT_57583 [Collybiopsis luxurians FD-317 M1]|uniref:Uncharacterized protein n=1 Tax=Collybiopsis luxurians FD-317 M1 TaxID=944289 RepID=A0A0D0CUU4_9AGAR|nr:hypothetical protein GYMLUDRAFT_57583 [Collybiopsis luxurians FD-317 M1]